MGDIDMELLDAGGVPLAIADSGDNDEFISYMHLGGPSTYYIKVYRYGDVDTNSNQYDLIWDVLPF